MLCYTLWMELYFGGNQLRCSDGRSATMDRPKHECKVYYGCLEDWVRRLAVTKGLVKREVIEHCIREIMEGERGEEIKKNALKWRKLAKEAVDEGGSSDKNIEEFVAKLVLHS
jgi:hypothetical protein